MKDLSRDILPAISFRDGARTTSANGDSIIDLQGFEGAVIIIASGTVTDGTDYTFELKHGDAANLSDAAAVDDADLVSGGPTAGDLEPVINVADDNHLHWFGYRGSKRYLRIDLKTVTGSPSTGGHFIGIVVKGYPKHGPVV